MSALVNSTLNRVVSAVLIACIAILNLPVPALAGDSAADDLKQIQYKYYFRGRYVEAIDVLSTFLARTDVDGKVEVNAREFLAASYILSDQPDKGKDQFLHLLTEDESYAGPDPDIFKAEVMDVFFSTRDTLAAIKLRTAPETARNSEEPKTAEVKESSPIYKKWWFYVGLVAVAVVVAAAASPQEEEPAAPPAPTGTVSVGVQIQ